MPVHMCWLPRKSLCPNGYCKKGILKSKDGQTASFVDDYASVSLNGEILSQTVRTAECELLVCNVKCKCCKQYRGIFAKEL